MGNGGRYVGDEENVGNGVGMRGIGVGMPGIGVGMQGIRVGIREIRGGNIERDKNKGKWAHL